MLGIICLFLTCSLSLLVRDFVLSMCHLIWESSTKLCIWVFSNWVTINLIACALWSILYRNISTRHSMFWIEWCLSRWLFAADHSFSRLRTLAIINIPVLICQNACFLLAENSATISICFCCLIQILLTLLPFLWECIRVCACEEWFISWMLIVIDCLLKSSIVMLRLFVFPASGYFHSFLRCENNLICWLILDSFHLTRL